MPWTLRMTLYSFLIALIPYCYVGWRMINAFSTLFPQSSRISRISIIIIFFFLNILPVLTLLYHLTNNTRKLFFHNPELTIPDYLILFPFWLGLILILELFPYILASDVIQLSVRLFSSTVYTSWIRWLAFMKIFLLVFFIIYVGFRVYKDTYTVRTVTYDLEIKNIPSSLNDLSLLLIADVQIDRYTQESKILEFKNQLRSNPADILFFAGDLITRGTNYIPQGLSVMCDTQSQLGRIACVGDHDFWADASRIAQGLTDCGWTFLNNAHHIIQHDSAQILITGITHVYSKRTSSRELENLLNNAPQADLKILLVHQPAKIVLDAAEKYDYHLLLAGHTHGGQVVFKPFGFTITPTQFENNIYSGFGMWKRLNVFVSNGIGISLMPLRFRAAAEILKININ